MSKFNSGYEQQLREVYHEDIVDQITDTMHAPSPFDKKVHVPYVRVESALDPKTDPTMFFIPGFGEGIINKASFAAELATQGANVVMIGQNRKRIRGDALELQAQNCLSVVSAIPDDGTTRIALPHSFGLPVFEEMVKKGEEQFLDWLAIPLAPSGSISNETYPKLAGRWLKMMKSESDNKRQMTFPDSKNVTGLASARVLLGNPVRTLKEIRALKKREVDYPSLRDNIGSLTVLSYAKDEMYPTELIQPRFEALQLLNQDIGLAVPYYLGSECAGEDIYSAEGATHDDEQFNPKRVARAVIDIACLHTKPS